MIQINLASKSQSNIFILNGHYDTYKEYKTTNCIEKIF